MAQSKNKPVCTWDNMESLGIPWEMGDFVTGKDRSFERSLYQFVKAEWSSGDGLKLFLHSVKFEGVDFPADSEYYSDSLESITKEYRIATRGELRYYGQIHNAIEFITEE